MPAFLPFAVPDIGDAEIAEVVDSLRSGWITTGPKARRFEQAFGEYLGGGLHCVAVNSATAGLHLSLEAIGIGPGDEVITTTHTFTASAEVARYLGAEPVLVDIDPATLCIDAAAIERAITPRTKAIIPVHYGGLACDMDAILDIARRHNLRVIEDAAHALPTTRGGKLVGTLDSDATVYSFYATKTLAAGEGGMVVTRDEKLAHRCRVMRLHGIDRDAFDRFTSTRPAWYYEIVAPGFKYNMPDISAALALVQLTRLEELHARRQAIARRYQEALRALPVILPPEAPEGDRHAWHLYVLRLADGAPIGRDDFIAAMAEAGIGCSVHYVPLHLQPYWRDRYQLKPEMFPHSQHAFERMVSLPIYTRMTDDDVTRVIDAVSRLLAVR
jgi:dTDP-4-amino-4,6-dideoxygalactose transaminase